ncbi:MAG: rRNA adenine N-6-methyltransferase family protein [Chloroflexota bacterium]
MADKPDSMPPDRFTLVDILRDAGKLTDPRVDEAFSTVSRHRFLPNVPLQRVYSDRSVPTRFDRQGRATVATPMPSMIAELLTQAQLREGQNVMHIGTGTGYTAALIHAIVSDGGHVTSLELEREVASEAEDKLVRSGAASVKVVHRDGADGYAPRAAYDRIIANVGMWDIPDEWVTQLKPGGLITVPIFLDGLQVSGAFRLQPDGSLLAESVTPSAFIYIRGRLAMPPVRLRISSTSLTLIADDVDRLDSAALHLLLSQDHDSSNRLMASLNKNDYWNGFLPYLVVNEPEEHVFAVYTIEEGQTAYGMAGEGFAVFTPASAVFVPYDAAGQTESFAGADAFMELEGRLQAWEAAGRPGIERLRIRLIPRSHGVPTDVSGKLYPRANHYLHMWMDLPEKVSGAADALNPY